MKGPSLEAIRRFKEQQERKKLEEYERKIQDKLSTLKHRASQGDRKAKQELKKIEKIEEDKKKSIDLQINQRPIATPQDSSRQILPAATKRPKQVETDFDELMKLAKQNTNEIKKPEEPKPPTPTPKKTPSTKPGKPILKSPLILPPSSPSSSAKKSPIVITKKVMRVPQSQPRQPPAVYKHQFRPQKPVYEEDEEDGYESDDFVVDDEDDDVSDELRKTIRSVFKYDKRRCDFREQELDRHYREIGRVSTFEDLEREERRASKLAASEDARALREEEQRKKLKKLRLQKLK